MGKYYAGYQLFQILDDGVGPSKIIWQWDGSRRVFYLDYGSESLRGETYINSGPSLGEYTKFIPNRPLEPEDHIPEILAMFAPQLFLTRAKYDKISAEMKKILSKDKNSASNMFDFDLNKTPGVLNEFIHEIDDEIKYTILSSVLSQARFKSNDGKKWILYCTRLDQKEQD